MASNMDLYGLKTTIVSNIDLYKLRPQYAFLRNMVSYTLLYRLTILLSITQRQGEKIDRMYFILKVVIITLLPESMARDAGFLLVPAMGFGRGLGIFFFLRAKEKFNLKIFIFYF